MTDDTYDDGYNRLADPHHREVALNAHRWMLGLMEGREVAFAPGTSPEYIRRLSVGVAATAVGQMVAQARLERRLSLDEAQAEIIAWLTEEVTKLELLSLDDSVPFPGGQPPQEAAMRDGAEPVLSPAEVRAVRRLWEYVADVAVDDRHPRLPSAELTEIAEGLAGLVLGMMAGTDGREAAAAYVLAQRDLYGSLDAGD